MGEDGIMFGYGNGVSVVSVIPEVRFDDIKYFAESPFDTFEVTPKNFATDYDGAIRREFAAMCDATGKRAISYHIPFKHEDDLSNPVDAVRKRAMDRFMCLLDEAAMFKSELIVLHPSAEPVAPETRERRIELLREAMNAVEGELRSRGQRLALEFLPRGCMGNTLDDILRMLEGFSDTFGCCADVNHLMGQFEDIPAMVRTLGKQLITLHLSDYDGIDERHWVPQAGAGVINWPEFMKALREINYRGPFNLETKCEVELDIQTRIRNLDNSIKWLHSL